MSIAVIVLDFDPLLSVGDGTVRWETLGVAAAAFVAIVIAGLLARRLQLRLDDLLFIVLGVIPGAVIGGRIGYVLLHLDYYAARPSAIVDPGQGSLELALAVVGGTLSGAFVAGLLDGSRGRWLHVAALPTLIALGFGKLAMILGGSGQGVPSVNDWSTAYIGPGPWGSLAPALPSHPSQLYEGLASLAVAALMIGLLAAADVFRTRDGRAFLVAIGLWAVARGLVASTWRDPLVLGPFNAEQLIDVAIAAGCALLAARMTGASRRRGRQPTEPMEPIEPIEPIEAIVESPE